MVGLRRHVEALRDQRPDVYGCTGAWDLHIVGACGELAVAKVLKRYWSGTVNTYKNGGDIGRRMQVRTRTRAGYELLVRDSDRDDDVFVLVRGEGPVFEVVGWLLGREAKQAQWKQTHGGRAPAYFVPDDALHDLEHLR